MDARERTSVGILAPRTVLFLAKYRLRYTSITSTCTHIEMNKCFTVENTDHYFLLERSSAFQFPDLNA